MLAGAHGETAVLPVHALHKEPTAQAVKAPASLLVLLQCKTYCSQL